MEELLKDLEKAFDSLPFAIRVALMDENNGSITKYVNEKFNNEKSAKQADDIFALCEMDASALVGDDPIAKNALAFLLTNMHDFATAGALVVFLNKYVFPMAEKKKALEQMILTLEKGKENGQGS